MTIAFRKMHGLGNDFVIIDQRGSDIALDAQLVRQMADRRRGVGCDQLIVLRGSDTADVAMDIYNQDGSTAEACGNATRCVAHLIMDGAADKHVDILTAGGLLRAERSGSDISVDMGAARLHAADVPLADDMDTLAVNLDIDGLGTAICASMGNPHATFFTDDVAALDIQRLGPLVERHRLFPDRVNAGFAQVVDDGLRLRVWERSVGVTDACGTAACAAAVAAMRSGRIDARSVTVHLDGGPLQIEWRDNGHVIMTGPVAESFTGQWQI